MSVANDKANDKKAYCDLETIVIYDKKTYTVNENKMSLNKYAGSRPENRLTGKSCGDMLRDVLSLEGLGVFLRGM